MTAAQISTANAYFTNLQASFANENNAALRDNHTSAATIMAIADEAIFHATTAQDLGLDELARSWRHLVVTIREEARRRA